MSHSSLRRSEEFLAVSGQFQLGALVTESSHPVTADLGSVAKKDVAAALQSLFAVDDDVLRKFRELVASGRAGQIKKTLVQALKNGGRIFFTGCGATGRLSILLDSVWRDFWQNQKLGKLFPVRDYETRTFSVMAGGDYALIKSVEGFEDFTAFGEKQIRELAVTASDVVFAITEGGETSFVIGTAQAGVAAGAKVYFVYNNPDDVLCRTVERSREIIADPRIEKINLTTGPMAIMGSTRMQATSIQLCVMLTVLEMVVRELLGLGNVEVPDQFLEKLTGLHAGLQQPEFLADLAKLVALEESTYRFGHKHNYYADRLAVDVLTDTTERSPTFSTPSFRKFDDAQAAASWAFLFLPQDTTELAWQHLLKRQPRCVEWSPTEIAELVPADKISRTLETIRKIGPAELMRFRIGINGAAARPLIAGDSATVVAKRSENNSSRLFLRDQLELARNSGCQTGLIHFGAKRTGLLSAVANFTVIVPVPESDLLLDGVTHVAAKLVMNALSTCTMVRLGRVMGNSMIHVVPSNLKLIDRATRYLVKLTGLAYEPANQLLFEAIEYVEPRMKTDQAYPPVVGLAALRAQRGLSFEAAEQELSKF